MPRILVIYNPIAGRGRVRKLWPRVERALRDAGLDFDAVPTRAPREATEIARNAVGRYARLVGIGGDGTMSEIVNGLLQGCGEAETPPLGIVPLGNGDDFAKMLPPQASIGGSCYDWRAAIGKIVAGKTRLVDVGRMRGDESAAQVSDGYHYFLNVLDVGFGAHTVKNFGSVPTYLSGHAAYLWAVMKTLVDFPTLTMRIQFDDLPAFEQVTTIAAVGNGRCFGGGLWVCPDAVADDGLFDVMVTEKLSRWTIFRLLPKLQRGKHIADSAVKMHRARRVVLDSSEPFVVEADGEVPIGPTRRLEIEALPNRVRLIV